MKELLVRPARHGDAAAVARLVAMLGYPTTLDTAGDNLAQLTGSGSDYVLVAELGGTVAGLAHLHVAKLLHTTGSIGRVMALVVHVDHTNQGIGRALMQAMEDIARERGCPRMELTSGAHRDEAHAFYRALGYTEHARRFVKTLGPSSP